MRRTLSSSRQVSCHQGQVDGIVLVMHDLFKIEPWQTTQTLTRTL